MSKDTATKEVEKVEKGMKKCIEGMKEKQIEVNFKCTQYDALMVALGETAALVGVHIIMSVRRKAKIKKQLAKKYEKKCEKEVEKRVKREVKELAKATEEEAN
ncbi:MAG: hypothetical protein J6C89_05485 [Clostridia bacterium]|nr:hypothetical protein [Clostridia bacterium]